MISIVTPVYKAEKLLDKCVSSVKAQDYEDWELILVDDGSPDGSGALCDQLAEGDRRIRAFHKENGGVSSARNFALERVKGDYVTFLDADDYLAPNTCSALLAALQDAQADVAGCGVRMVDAAYREGIAEAAVLPAGVYEHDVILEKIVDRLVGDRLSYPPLNGYAVRFLFRRELLEGLRFRGAYLEDELFMLEYFCRPQRLVTVDEPFYYYYWNPASATHHYMPGYLDTFRAFLEAKEELVERFDLAGRMPGWRANTCWAGLLIAVANEFAPGNGHRFGEQKRRLRALLELPEMARAVEELTPTGMGRNKQLVADLLRKRRFGLITLLYRVKNRS